MIERVPIESLHLDPANVRRHPEKNLKAIMASLKRFGQQTPILVGENDVVRAGNGTVTAAGKLGWTHVDIIRSELAGSEMTAYAIADNRTAELSQWDMVPLATTLRSLDTDESALEGIGFTTNEVDAMLDGLGTGLLGGSSDSDDDESDDEDEDEEYERAIRYQIEFESVEQQDHWFGFVRWLKGFDEYEAETIAGRIDLFLADQGISSE